MSAGYSPRRTGSRYQRLRDPSCSFARRDPRRSVGERLDLDEVDRDPDPRSWRIAPQNLHGPAMGQEDVVRGGERVGLAAAAGRVQAEPVAEPRDHPGLVLRDPGADPVAEAPDDGLHVLGEGADRVTGRPATAILERLRQVPVVEGRERLDPVREQLVDEAVVEVEPRRVRLAASRPGARAARRSRTGRRRDRARASAGRPPGSGDTCRTRRRRRRRCGRFPARR